MISPKALGAILLAGAALYAVASVTGSGMESSDAGPAPDIRMKTLDGRTVRLSDLKGKVVLLDFWATWCGPCRESIPAIQRIYAKHKDKGFEVMGIALERDSGAQLPGFAREMGMTYPIGLPITREEVQVYNDTGAIPLMVIVDKKGHIRGRQQGYAAALEAGIEQKVKELLAE